MWLSYGPNDKAFWVPILSSSFPEFLGRPTFDPRPGYEGRSNKNNVARYLDWLPDNDVKWPQGHWNQYVNERYREP